MNYLVEVEAAIANLRLEPRPHQDERLEALRQEYETLLTLLESEFIGALATGDWSEFDRFVSEMRGTR